MNEIENVVEEHHKQQKFCDTRPAYRASKSLTAIKVYTVAVESQHLFIYNVPKINLRKELKSLCLKYGQILMINAVCGYKTELFTECYHVQYDRIQAARVAKRLMDNKSFYGQVLHVCYAPEYENIEETRSKLTQRKKEVLKRVESQEKLPYDQKTIDGKLNFITITKSQLQKKRKYPDNSENDIKETLEACSSAANQTVNTTDYRNKEYLNDFYSLYSNKKVGKN